MLRGGPHTAWKAALSTTPAFASLPGEAEEDDDFGRGKKGKDKKGKKGGKAAADDDDDDFDFGAKGKKGRDKKGGKAVDVAEAATPEAGAPKVVCTVLDVRPHVDAKKLQVCTVDGGDDVGTVQVVCGGTNVVAGMVTVLAPIGSSVTTQSGAPLAIKGMAIRGEKSEGMLCGLGELGKVRAPTGGPPCAAAPVFAPRGRAVPPHAATPCHLAQPRRTARRGQ